MRYTVVESKVTPGHFFVDEDARYSLALFMGPRAQELAQEYADWKNEPLRIHHSPEEFDGLPSLANKGRLMQVRIIKCQCAEIGSDGTKAHNQIVAKVSMGLRGGTTGSTCSNHRGNYARAGWQIFPLRCER